MSETNETICYTADIIAIRGRQVLAIERGHAPFQGCLALPGGHVNTGETSRNAAAREAKEETNLTIDPDHLTLVGIYDTPDRDPRGRVVSVAYAIKVPINTVATAGDDASTAEWHDFTEVLAAEMAFDHHNVIADAYQLHALGLIPEPQN